MSWRGKRKGVNLKSDEESPSNKNPKLESSDDSDNLFVCEISKNRRVALRSWQGNPVVDIREFYVKDGKQHPGKKGCLPNSITFFNFSFS
ncbi:Rna polymerase ii transcriptional coactivator kiwi [Thalictrum thalictroides]|uniref:Rna polymerase ii transcriptional coactivator kiwi n=1 Tax=Thalictrum thalictroides TaxID=46969 RepID=A0A7J6VJK4_THATH|nr:Rna polymerase ii transcriptional coactivator kiwi [Thalictrum thalictroides]